MVWVSTNYSTKRQLRKKTNNPTGSPSNSKLFPSFLRDLNHDHVPGEWGGQSASPQTPSVSGTSLTPCPALHGLSTPSPKPMNSVSSTGGGLKTTGWTSGCFSGWHVLQNSFGLPPRSKETTTLRTWFFQVKELDLRVASLTSPGL